MTTIRDLPGAWRARLLPATYDDCEFHVETGSRESGRRIVVHEFPKKEVPYSEDMGRRAIEFTVRGYCIQYPFDVANSRLYQRDYQVARDFLQKRLDAGGPGWLQLPTMEPVEVVCPRYRLTEEERLGGYCVFDMTFVEWGKAPFQPSVNSQADLLDKSNALTEQALQNLGQQRLKELGASGG